MDNDSVIRLSTSRLQIETPFQALLQPSAKEILEAVRAIFLQVRIYWIRGLIPIDSFCSSFLYSTELHY